MTTLNEMTVEQLNNQFIAIMTTIKSCEDVLTEETIDTLYAEVKKITEEIESRDTVSTTTDSMFS